MVPFGLQTVTPQHVGVDQSKPFSLVKLVGPRAAVCRRYEKILPHGSKVSRSKSRPCRAGSRFPCIILRPFATIRRQSKPKSQILLHRLHLVTLTGWVGIQRTDVTFVIRTSPISILMPAKTRRLEAVTGPPL